jgi:hypothetical protein
VPPVRSGTTLIHCQARRITRHEHRARASGRRCRRNDEKLGKRRIHHFMFEPIDDPPFASADGHGGESWVVLVRLVIVTTQRAVAGGLLAGERDVMALIRQKWGKKALPLPWRHQAIKQNMGKGPGLAQHSRNSGIAGSELFTDNAGSEAVCPCPTRNFRERERAQAELRSLVEHINEQRLLRCLKALGPERGRLDLARDELAHRVADFQLLGGKAQIIH